MLAAIGEFACREKPRHLLLIRLVIFNREMLPGFEDALKQEEGRSFKKQASLLSRGFGKNAYFCIILEIKWRLSGGIWLGSVTCKHSVVGSNAAVGYFL